MALSTPAGVHILVGGVDVTGDIYTAAFEEENLIEETHTFGDAWEEQTSIGIAKFMLTTGDGLYDDRAVGMLQAFRNPVSPPQSPNTSPQLVALTLNGDSIGEGSMMLNGSYVTKFNRQPKKDGLTMGHAEHSVSGARVFGHVLHGLTMVTANGNTEATPADAMFPDPAVDILTSAVGGPGVITTRTAHGLQVGDFAFISGHSGSTPSLNGVPGSAGALVISVPSDHQFTISNITVAGTGGTVQRMKSLTIVSSNASDVITTSVAHGLSVGDRIFVAGHTGSTPNLNTVPYGSLLVSTVPTPTTFTTPVDVTVGGAGGVLSRIGLHATFSDLHVPELTLGDHAGLQVKVRSCFDNNVYADAVTFSLVTDPGHAERKSFADIGRFRAISWLWSGASVSPSASASPSSSASSSASASASPSSSASSSASASASPSSSASGSPSSSASGSPSSSASPSATVSPSGSRSPSASASPSRSPSPSPSRGTQESAIIFVHTELGN